MSCDLTTPMCPLVAVGGAYLWSRAVATDREAMALIASASSESARLASSSDSSSLGE